MGGQSARQGASIRSRREGEKTGPGTCLSTLILGIALVNISVEILSSVIPGVEQIFGLFSVHWERSFSLAILNFLDSSILIFVDCYHVTSCFYSSQS